MRTIALESVMIPRVCKMASMFWEASPVETLQKLHDYLRARFVYAEERIETILTPDYMLRGLENNRVLIGDCDDISTLHATLLTCLGFPVRFVAIRSERRDPNFDHVFIQTRLNNEWITYDLTVPDGTTLEFVAKVEITI